MKVKNLDQRQSLMDYLKQQDIQTAFHYIPLHHSDFGQRHGDFVGQDTYTTTESERLLRLPLFFNLKESDVDYIVSHIFKFYNVSR